MKGIAVVTGGSSGIGAAIARELTRRGMRCVLVARREEPLRALAEQLGGEYELCDVRDRVAVDAVAARIGERHPRLALLVNSAGIAGRANFLGADPERIEDVLQTNYLGGVWFLRALLPALEAGRGAVVNIVSVAGAVVSPQAGPYSAAKHAQLAFSRAIAPELRRRGIRVHTVLPGFVETEGFPQTALRSPLLRRVVIRPDAVADSVADAVEHDRHELFVPAWYRAAAWVQALAPTAFARLLDRGAGYRRVRG
jgi:short-subunit dehydrogenase